MLPREPKLSLNLSLTPMVYTRGAQVLPAAREALKDIEIDTPPPPPPLPVPMEWETQACSVPLRELLRRIAIVRDTGAVTHMDWGSASAHRVVATAAGATAGAAAGGAQDSQEHWQ